MKSSQIRDGGNGRRPQRRAHHAGAISDRPFRHESDFRVGILQPLIEALPALKAAKLDLPVAGFDVSSEVLDAIKSGKIIATVDQQPYSQGFYAVTELALEIKYGLFPSDMKTGGEGLVDKTNYEPAVKYAGKYR